MGYGVGHRTYHTPVVRGPITKDIGYKTPMMVDEASSAFDDLIGAPEGRLPLLVIPPELLTPPQSTHPLRYTTLSP